MLTFSKSLNLFAAIAASCLFLGCGEPCKALDAKICADLGDADCKLWRDKGRPGFPGTGRRPTRSCVNAAGNYDTHLGGIKKGVQAYKDAEKKVAEAQAKRDAKQDAPKPGKEAEPNKAAAGDTAQCTALVDKICADLGSTTCEKWKDAATPGLNANKLQCKLAMKNPTIYNKFLKSVQQAVK